jgi:hypothetical protein
MPRGGEEIGMPVEGGYPAQKGLREGFDLG